MTPHTQRITRDFYQQLYTIKMGNLEEMDKFLERYNIPRANQEEIENINREVTSIGIEIVVLKTPNKQKSRMKSLHRQILSNI